MQMYEIFSAPFKGITLYVVLYGCMLDSEQLGVH